MTATGLKRWILPASFLVLACGAGAVFLLAPHALWLLVLPVLLWGALFMVWAYWKLKDPRYYR